jgi:hypothetical protein
MTTIAHGTVAVPLLFWSLFPSSQSISLGYPSLSLAFLPSTIQLSSIVLLNCLENQQKEMQNRAGMWRGSTSGASGRFLFFLLLIQDETLGEYPHPFPLLI